MTRPRRSSIASRALRAGARLAWLAALAPAVGAVRPPPPAAADVAPPTAESSSLRMPVLLLDSSASGWAFPQTSAESGTGVRAWSAGPSRPEAFGSAARLGDLALDYRIRPDVPSAARLQRSHPWTRIGVAGRAGALRLGLAWTWGSEATKTRWSSEIEAETGYRRQSTDLVFDRVDAQEVLVGIGWRSRNGASIDLGLGGRRDAFEWSSSEQSRSQSSPTTERVSELRADFDRDGGFRPLVRLRLASGPGSAPGFRMVADWRRERQRFTMRRRDESQDTNEAPRIVRDTIGESEDGATWGAAAALGRPASGRPGWWIHVRFEQSEPPSAFRASTGWVDRERTRSRAAGTGVAAIVPLRRGMDLLAGVDARWLREIEERGEIYLDEIGLGERYRRGWKSQREDAAAEFGWGLRIRRETFDVTVQLEATPSLTDSFLGIDLELRP